MQKTQQKPYYLVCENVKYHGEMDEEMFFLWVRSIECIDTYQRIGNALYLYLKFKKLTSLDLYDLLYLFKRYKIDMTQLRPFLTEKNQKIFMKRKNVYWYKPLFGDNN